MLRIRSYRRADLDQCTELFISAFSKKPWYDQWPSRERAQAYLSDLAATPGFRGYVAGSDGKIVGLCFGHVRRWWRGDEYMIDELCVDIALQGQGIGTVLMGHVKNELAAEGVGTILCLTKRDTPAEGYYRKQGFEASPGMALMHWNRGEK